MSKFTGREAGLFGFLVILFVFLLTGCDMKSKAPYERAAKGPVVELKQSSFCALGRHATGLQSYILDLGKEGIRYDQEILDSVSCIRSEDLQMVVVPKVLLPFEVKIP